ncbi:hypothetical protein K438DRAFT_883742 [Mycena galopus ATCC 62051]|nr:hypothetical protein K438DRAFT_883742 [Mycena galopus ATCC 62051]
MSLPNCIDSKSDPNRARRLLDQIAAEAQSSRNSTPVVRAIRNVQQVTPKPSNRELQSISTTVSSPLRPAHGTFQATDSSRPQSWGGRSLRRNIDSAAQKLTQPFEQNGNVPDVLGEQSSGGEQILPVFGPPPKPNSVGSNRPSISHKRPHSPLISSPLGRTEREINPSFVGVMQISKDHGPMIKPEGVFPLKSTGRKLWRRRRNRSRALPGL